MGINYKKIGTKIKEYRIMKNYTQENLAEKTNLSVIHMRQSLADNCKYVFIQ